MNNKHCLCEHPVIMVNPVFKKIFLRNGIYMNEYGTHRYPLSKAHREFPYFVFNKKSLKITEDNLDEYYTHDADGVVVPAFVSIPCGKCPICRDVAMREYCCRAVCESQTSSSVPLFLTLTYNDDHLPDGANLCKRDVQLFFKRLRKHLEKKHPDAKLRYIYCGEYGTYYGRPHYHAIVWNYPYEEELTPYVPLSYQALPTIEKCWNNGFVYVSDTNFGGIQYVMKYMRKDCPTVNGRTDIFFSASRRDGGLGKKYFVEKLRDYYLEHPEDNTIVVTDKFTNRSYSAPLPSYFKELLYQTQTFVPVKIKNKVKSLQKLIKIRWSFNNTFHPVNSKFKLNEYYEPVGFFAHWVLQKFDPVVPYYPDYMLSTREEYSRRLFNWCRLQSAKYNMEYADYVDANFDKIINAFDEKIHSLTQELLKYRFNKTEYISLQRLKQKRNDYLALKHEHQVVDDELVKYKVYTILEKRKKQRLREIF